MVEFLFINKHYKLLIEVKEVKLILDLVANDNRVLAQDVEDFKSTIEFLVNQHKKLQTELEVERSKSSRIQLLEYELKQEKV